MEDLLNRKIKLSILQKNELFEWFKNKQDIILKKYQEIDKLEFEINQKIYEIYELTNEEIEFIEMNISS